MIPSPVDLDKINDQLGRINAKLDASETRVMGLHDVCTRLLAALESQERTVSSLISAGKIQQAMLGESRG